MIDPVPLAECFGKLAMRTKVNMNHVDAIDFIIKRALEAINFPLR